MNYDDNNNNRSLCNTVQLYCVVSQIKKLLNMIMISY